MKITKKMINELAVKSYSVLNEDDSSEVPKIVQWIQKNPKLAAGITTIGLPLSAAIAITHYQDKKAEKEKDNDDDHSSSGNMPSSQDLTNLTTGGFM